MATATLSIAGRVISTSQRPLIVAELSGNHNGSLERALKIVRAAAAAGADAIKLQTYTPATLTIDSDRPEFFINDPSGPWHGRRLWELYEEAHTPWDWHAPLFAAARDEGMLCFSSAYDVSSVAFLADAKVDAIKIASFELVHLPLIEAAARTELPLLISTGMGTHPEIADAVRAATSVPSPQFMLLVCTSAYPSDEDDAHLSRMHVLREHFHCPVGLSDHTIAPYTAFAATALGAVMIEKHVTLARADGGPDAEFSLEPHELRELVTGCDRIWRSLGHGTLKALPAEAASMRERPSVRVVRVMKRGEVFSAENLRVVRPGNGLAPVRYHELLGKRCARDIEEGEPMSWELVDGVHQ